MKLARLHACSDDVFHPFVRSNFVEMKPGYIERVGQWVKWSLIDWQATSEPLVWGVVGVDITSWDVDSSRGLGTIYVEGKEMKVEAK